MAREIHDREPKGIAVDCTFCDYRNVSVRTGSERASCPSCGEAFSVHVTDRFTLIENDGWAVTVSLDTALSRPPAGEGP